MKKFFSDFKAFITRGNVMDLAVAVIIGAAFSAIVTSLVNDLIMPLIVWVTPVQNLSELAVVLRPESVEGAGDALLWHYGNFIQAIINFLLVATIVFLMLKAVMGAKGFLTPKYGDTLTKKEYFALRKQGKTKQEIAEIDRQKTEERKAEEAAKKAEAEANTTEAILKDIRSLLAEKNGNADGKEIK